MSGRRASWALRSCRSCAVSSRQRAGDLQTRHSRALLEGRSVPQHLHRNWGIFALRFSCDHLTPIFAHVNGYFAHLCAFY